LLLSSSYERLLGVANQGVTAADWQTAMDWPGWWCCFSWFSQANVTRPISWPFKKKQQLSKLNSQNKGSMPTGFLSIAIRIS
jgi:hypothetical protein